MRSGRGFWRRASSQARTLRRSLADMGSPEACCTIGVSAPRPRRSKRRQRKRHCLFPVTMAKASETAIEEAAIGKTAPGSVSRGLMIEIETAGALIRVPEGVDAKTLSVVLAALRRAS